MSNGIMKRSNHRRLAVIVFGILAIVFTCSALTSVVVQVPGIQAFYGANPQGITFQDVRVPLRDGNSLAAYVVLPAGADVAADNSTPLVVLSPGINGRKESMLWKGYNFALNGVVAIAVEARGNGDSSGIVSFGIDEPADLSDTITWALGTYPIIGSGNVSLCGQSLGAMFSVLAACKDPRIAATAAYHPPANFTSMLTNDFPVADLIGNLPNFPLDDESLRARSPINWINAVLPHKILFLHGQNDTEVLPDNSFSLSERANDSGHTDTYVIVRPGLDHTENENDPESLSLAIAWLNSSLSTGMVPSPSELWAQAGAIVVEDVPLGSVDTAGACLVVAAISFFLAVFIGFRGLIAPGSASSLSTVASPSPSRAVPSRRAVAITLGTVLAIAFVLGILVGSGVTSIMWGYLLFFPASVLAFLVIVKYYLVRGSGILPGIEDWSRGIPVRNWLAGFLSVAATAIFFSASYDASANAIKDAGMSIFNSAFLLYTTIFFLNFAIDIALVDVVSTSTWKKEPNIHHFSRLCKDSGYVFVWRFASMGLFLPFLPLINISIIPVSINLLILIGIPVLMAGVYFLGGVLDRGLHSRTLAIIVLVVLLAAFLEYRTLRFF